MGPTLDLPAPAASHRAAALRARREERICAENVQHEYDGHFFSDPDAHVPTAIKPDF
jgi:hypothetical protein